MVTAVTLASALAPNFNGFPASTESCDTPPVTSSPPFALTVAVLVPSVILTNAAPPTVEKPSTVTEPPKSAIPTLPAESVAIAEKSPSKEVLEAAASFLIPRKTVPVSPPADAASSTY